MCGCINKTVSYANGMCKMFSALWLFEVGRLVSYHCKINDSHLNVLMKIKSAAHHKNTLALRSLIHSSFSCIQVHRSAYGIVYGAIPHTHNQRTKTWCTMCDVQWIMHDSMCRNWVYKYLKVPCGKTVQTRSDELRGYASADTSCVSCNHFSTTVQPQQQWC